MTVRVDSGGGWLIFAPTTTRHLAVLVDSGLVTVRKSGRERLYRLNRDRLVGGLGLWLHQVEIGVIDHRRRRSSQ